MRSKHGGAPRTRKAIGAKGRNLNVEVGASKPNRSLSHEGA